MYRTKYRTWILFIGDVLIYLPSCALSASRCDDKEPVFNRTRLTQILRRDHLSVPIDKQVELKHVGNIKVNTEICFSFYMYESEVSSGPESNPHYTARLLIIKNGRYIGMYIVDQPPILVVNGNTILFLGEEKWGNKIVFDKSDPPRQIHLRGEFRDLVK